MSSGTINRSISAIFSAFIVLGWFPRLQKFVVNLGRDFQASHAFFMPIPANEKAVSQPVNAWKKSRAVLYPHPKNKQSPELECI